MGMTCSLWRASESDIERLSTASVADIETFMFGRPTAPPKRQPGLVGWLKSLSPIQIETAGDTPLADDFDERADRELHLEGTWHGLHYLFTGTAWEGEEPACLLLKGGDDLGDDEIGNSVPRVVRPQRLEEFAKYLSQLSDTELTRRYNPVMMMKLDIDPGQWDEREQEELAGLLAAYRDVRDFVGQAAAAGDGLIIHVD
jgi:hypothetical protein